MVYPKVLFPPKFIIKAMVQYSLCMIWNAAARAIHGAAEPYESVQIPVLHMIQLFAALLENRC